MALSVRFITLDLFETCIHIHPSLSYHYTRVANKYAIDLYQNKVETNFRSVYKMLKNDLSHLYYDPNKSQDWWHRVASRTIELSSVAPSPNATRINHVSRDLFEEFKTTRCWSVYPDAIDFLDHCRDNSLPLAGISNFDQRLSPLLSSLSISKYFLFVMTLAYKPNTHCFEEALERTGYDPTDCCHIGDSIREDCMTALSIGMKPVLINRREDEKYVIQQLRDSGIDVKDVIIVKSLSELKNKIKIYS